VRPSEKLSEGVNRKPYYLWSRSLGLKTVQHCIGGVLWKGPGTAFRMHCKVFGRPYYRSSLWYSMSSVCSLSSVCDVLYCGKTVRPSEKVSEGVNRKPGSKSWFFGSSPYFYFRFGHYGHGDGRLFLIFARTAQWSVLDGTDGLSSSKPCAHFRTVQSSVSSVSLSVCLYVVCDVLYCGEMVRLS